MTMQRRHFELIAEVLSGQLARYKHGDLSNDSIRYNAVVLTAYSFVCALRTTNPNFNEAKFLKACGVDS